MISVMGKKVKTYRNFDICIIYLSMNTTNQKNYYLKRQVSNTNVQRSDEQ